MTKGPAAGKNIRFTDSDGYPSWGKIIDSDTQGGEAGWIVEREVYDDDEGEVTGTEQIFVIVGDITRVEEYPSEGDKQIVLYGQVGEPKITTQVTGGVEITEVDFEGGPQRLGEVCICTNSDGLRDLANFLLEQAEYMDEVGGDFDHAHYRNATRLYPDIIVSKIPDEDRETEENAPTIN